MRSFRWSILAGCVGAWWLLAALAAPGPTPSRPEGSGWRADGGDARGLELARGDDPGRPGGVPDIGWEAAEVDPEGWDVEAQLVGWGGAAWAGEDRPDWSRPGRAGAPPLGDLMGSGRRAPRAAPIRC